MEFAQETRDGNFSPHTVRLAWILTVAYLLVILYASLQPFRDWRVPPEEILHFLFAPWPRFITLQDVTINIGAYFPLGLLLSVGLGVRIGPARGVIIATLAATGVSLAMEAAQMFLPARIASNVDLLSNGMGALLGAVAALLLAPTRVLGSKLHAVRHRLFVEGLAADFGLVIAFLWLITQFHPTAQLFGTGYLRATLDLPAQFAHSPGLVLAGEAAVTAFNLLGVGLMLSAFMRDGVSLAPIAGALIGFALAIKTLTAAALVQIPAPLAWLTPGVFGGLVVGGLLLWSAARLPHEAKIALSAVCIVIAAAAINFAPENPYQSVPPRLLARGASHFLSFSGIVRALSDLWPGLATVFLVSALAARRH